jgi:CheY-like chemotaxis protein
MADKPIVLCVDDESHVMESMKLNLRRHYDVRTALSGQEGLELLLRTSNVAVAISDMRMPEMNGATFLSMVRKVAPDTVRILLTGYADVESAMRAVNEGQVFRFLTKPCSPPDLLATIAAGVEQHRLITAERVLLQNTLIGSVRALVDVLALVNPLALGRAIRVRDRVRRLASALGLDRHWHAEFAALLSQLGAVLLPEDTARRLYDGDDLDEEERRSLVENMDTINRILGNIPRLEPVTEVLEELRGLLLGDAAPRDQSSVAARLVHAVIELDGLEAQGRSLRQSLQILAEKSGPEDGEILKALETLIGEPGARETLLVKPDELTDGMVLAQDLKTDDGLLILPRGFELGHSAREHIANFVERLSATRIKVAVSADSSHKPAPNIETSSA